VVSDRPQRTLEILCYILPFITYRATALPSEFASPIEVCRLLPLTTIGYWHVSQVIRIHAFQTANIESKFVRIGASSMMGVDAAYATKEMLGDLLSKLIFA
jgi:hypothetical protein